VREQAGWDEHAEFIDGLVARGTMVMGGPFEDSSGSMILLEGVDVAEAERLIVDDPFLENGVFLLDEIREWTIFVDEPTRSGRDAAPDFGDAIRAKWSAGEPTFGGWCAVPSPLSAEILAQCGFDWVCVDLQHGLAGLESVAPMLQAISISGAAPLVRVPANEPWLIMRALDLGAAGVVVPLVSSPDEAAKAAAACRYPPDGMRSYGPVRTSSPRRIDAAHANTQVLCLVMIETAGGVELLPEICQVPGVDGVYVGPRDLALTHGLSPGEDLDALIARILDTCRRLEIPAGIHTRSGADARAYAEAGFLWAAVASDRELLARIGSAELAAALGRAVSARVPDEPLLRASVSYVAP
jgi:4-hydroxy-2-oxoheptanedioate aldolase